jgi:hypothetical protein
MVTISSKVGFVIPIQVKFTTLNIVVTTTNFSHQEFHLFSNLKKTKPLKNTSYL